MTLLLLHLAGQAAGALVYLFAAAAVAIIDKLNSGD